MVRNRAKQRWMWMVWGGALAFALLSYGRGANASSQSIITLAFGVDCGVLRYAAANDFEETVAPEISARLRLVKILGVSFTYNPIAAEGGELGLGTNFRMSGILYLVPTRWVSFYLAGGVGARDIKDLFNAQGATSSFHMGAGLEVYIGRHFALHLEYLWLIPGVRTIRGALDQTVDNVQEEIEEQLGELPDGTIPIAIPMPSAPVYDCFDAGNFQINFGLRYYL